MSGYELSDPKHPRHHATYADAYDARDKVAIVEARAALVMETAYREGISDGVAQGEDLVGEGLGYETFEAAELSLQVEQATKRRERAYWIGRLRGFRWVVRTRSAGRWGL